MKILKFSFLVLMVLCWGCSGNTASNTDSGTSNKASENLAPIASKANVSGNAKLTADTNPCDFFSADLIKKYFKTADKKITIRQSSIGDEFSKNCIAIWEADEDVRERLVDGYKHIAPALSSKFKYNLGTKQEAGWASDLINNLIRNGDSKTTGHKTDFNYDQLTEIGDTACWSKEKSHLIWRRGNDLFEVYVNIPVSSANRKAYAVAMALDINSQL